MDRKSTRLQFSKEELENSAVSKAASRAEKAADKADRAKAKLPADQVKTKGSKKLRYEEDIANERQAQLRFGKKEVSEKEAVGSEKLKGKSESKLKHSASASEKAFSRDGYGNDNNRETPKSGSRKGTSKTAASSDSLVREGKQPASVATSTDDFDMEAGKERQFTRNRKTAAKNAQAEKFGAKSTNAAKGTSGAAKTEAGASATEAPKVLKASRKLTDEPSSAARTASHLKFSDKNEVVKNPRLKGQPVTNTAGAALSGAVHKKISNSNEDDNEAVNAAQLASETAEAGSRFASDAGYSKKMRDYDKAVRLDQKADQANLKALYEADQAKNPEKYSNPISKWQQKRQIKKEYEVARAAASFRESAGGAEATGSTAKSTASGGKNLIQRLKDFAVEHSGFIKILLLLLLLVMFMTTMLQSCSTMFTGALTTVTATSWPSDDIDISKAEAYYVKLECELRKKIDKVPDTHSGSDEYNYDLADIGHDPSVLISYLSARFGGFKFADVKNEIERLFNLQYNLSITTSTENRTTTRTVNRGESLGSVVTSGYCNCSICCGRWAGGATASGVMPTANHTIAVDAHNPTVPMGTEIIMNGVLYKVEDTGNFDQYGVDFDVYYDSHSAASAHGHKTWEAYYVGGSGEAVTVTTNSNVTATTVKLTAKDLETICNREMTAEEKEIYGVYQTTHGNRMFFGTPVPYNWHENILYNYGYYYDAMGMRVKDSDDMVLSLPENVKVLSVMDGTVKSVSSDKVVLEDEHGYEISLSGLKNITVTRGAAVELGQQIAKVNSSLKLTISFKYRGTYFNPYFYMDTGTAVIASPAIASEKAAALINEAKKYLGTPYVWGGYSPSGFDCSGYVSYCLTHSGVKNTGHRTANGLLAISRRIPKEQLQPGDLVFFQGTYEVEGASHIGIYIGSGQYGAATFIHCGDPCQYGNLNSQYWIQHWLTAGRILD